MSRCDCQRFEKIWCEKSSEAAKKKEGNFGVFLGGWGIQYFVAEIEKFEPNMRRKGKMFWF